MEGDGRELPYPAAYRNAVRSRELVVARSRHSDPPGIPCARPLPVSAPRGTRLCNETSKVNYLLTLDDVRRTIAVQPYQADEKRPIRTLQVEGAVLEVTERRWRCPKALPCGVRGSLCRVVSGRAARPMLTIRRTPGKGWRS